MSTWKNQQNRELDDGATAIHNINLKTLLIFRVRSLNTNQYLKNSSMLWNFP